MTTSMMMLALLLTDDHGNGCTRGNLVRVDAEPLVIGSFTRIAPRAYLSIPNPESELGIVRLTSPRCSGRNETQKRDLPTPTT